MLVSEVVTSILHEAELDIRRALQACDTGDGWCEFVDEDGNPNPPTDERQVIVFLCGDRELTDNRPDDAGHGVRLGYFDHDCRSWRVSGQRERYVTHWRDLPHDPVIKGIRKTS
jgi:hypothetical protein